MPPVQTPPRIAAKIEAFIDPPTPYHELLESHLLQMAAVGRATGIVKLDRCGLTPNICLAANLQLWVVDWPKGRLDRKTPECIEAIATLWQRATAAVRAEEFVELMLEGVGQAIEWEAISWADVEALASDRCTVHFAELEAIANV